MKLGELMQMKGADDDRLLFLTAAYGCTPETRGRQLHLAPPVNPGLRKTGYERKQDRKRVKAQTLYQKEMLRLSQKSRGNAAALQFK